MMTLITGFTCPPTIYFKFITKCDSFFYYKVRWSVITKCDSFFITKCDRCYYKVRQLLQSVTILLQSATGITKCDDYYKVRQYKVTKLGSRKLQICPKVAKMGSIIAHRIDYRIKTWQNGLTFFRFQSMSIFVTRSDRRQQSVFQCLNIVLNEKKLDHYFLEFNWCEATCILALRW